MRRMVFILIGFVIFLTACKGKESVSSSQVVDPASQVRISLWNFTNEFEDGMLERYQKSHPDVIVEHTFQNNEYDEKLKSALLSGQGAPDCFGLNVANAKTYFESGLLLDITDIYEPYKDKLVKYQVEIGTVDSKVYGLSWQATPGGYYYRRSLAKKYLGTDDPQEVQTYFSDMNKFMETAALLYSKSGGSCVIIPHHSELLSVFTPNRSKPWIVNGQLEIDPLMMQYLDIAKTLYDKGYEARTQPWTEGWFTSMKSMLKNERGEPVDVFGYFLPTWGLSYVLKTNASETSGDWGLIAGPMKYYQGGTFIGAYKNTKFPEAAKELIRYLTCDDDFLEEWAKFRGDFVSSNFVNNKVKESFIDDFLGGQNHYALFSELAPYINGTLLQATDLSIDAIFTEAVMAYVYNEKSRDRALDDFQDQISNELGF